MTGNHANRIRQPNNGFTIVELLIVIVVIGILAAVTIVAYNGVQARARASSAQAALAQASQKLATYLVDNNSAYPPDLASIGITNTNDINFQYSYNNSVNPATYCVTATVSTTSYKADSAATQPVSGGCAGHGIGGVPPVTNLVSNPGATSSVSSEWASRYSMVRSFVTGAGDGPVAGLTTYVRETQGSALTGDGRGFDHRGNVDTSPTVGVSPWVVTAGVPVTVSSWIRSSWVLAGGKTIMYAKVHDGAGNWLSSNQGGPLLDLPTNTWVRIYVTFTPASSGYLIATSRTSGSYTWTTGTTIDATALMLYSGSTVYNYSDPITSPSTWVWSGTAHNSSSVGPGQ